MQLCFARGGGIDGLTYLNCQEALNYYIEQGYTYIEIDFEYTSDGYVVCSRNFSNLEGFDNNNRPTLSEFESSLLSGKYKTMTFEWLIDRISETSNIIIIFDTKEDNPTDLLCDMVEICELKNFDIFSRFIIQVYSIENYNEIKSKDLNFTFWFTNYKACYSPYEIYKYFYDKEDVETIVIKYTLWFQYSTCPLLKNKNLAIHTVNGEDTINYYSSRGVNYIFVDFC